MKEKFKLSFLSDGIGTVDIDEPFGFNTVSFDFMQKQKGMGRDISFNSGEMSLEFGQTRNHYLPELLYYFNYFGYEAKVQLIIEIDGLDNIIGDLDFAKSETDGLEYFRCKVIQKSELQTIKRRSKVKVDVFSNKDLDGNDIVPLSTTNVFVKAKSVFQESKWESKENYQTFLSTPIKRWAFINPCVNLITSEIEDSYSIFQIESGFKDDYSFYELLKAKDNLTNITLTIEDVFFNGTLYGSETPNLASGKGTVSLILQKGTEIVTLYSKTVNNAGTFSLPKTTYTFNYPSLNRGESIYLAFKIEITQTDSTNFPFRILYLNAETNISKTSIIAQSTAYNSVTNAVRLNDVQKQVIKSYAGIGVDAPRYEPNGQFYDTFLINGNLLRGIKNKPFTISLDDLENSLTEHNGDYEVNGKVFFGIEQDFYTSLECGFFDNMQFSAFRKKFNEKYSINTFNFKYKNYQALKENEQPNSSDTIQGEIEMLLTNKMVENTKSVVIEWTRDSFLIDEARKKSIEISSNTSYQNDTDIFALDCVKNNVDLSFMETSELNHEWNPQTSKLSLRSNQSLSFKIIGIYEGTPFSIKAPDKNAGNYTVSSVSEQELQLVFVSGGVMTVNNNGVRYTQYVYTIPKEQIPYIGRTTEGVNTTSNIRSPETFANLLYSVKRNIINYYKSYLATCNLYNKTKEITTTLYKNNGEAIIDAGGLTTKENESLIPANPILSPYMYEDMVYCNVDIIDFINLQKELRSKRGYVRSIDKNGNPIKVYPTKMTYKNLEKELTIVAEEKYEPVIMTLETSAMFTTINGETKVSHLEWKIENNLLSVFDRGRYRLYCPVFWYNVSINGTLSETINILEDRLKLIK